MLPILAQQYELELLRQGPSGQSHSPICLGKGTGNRAKGLERVYMTSYSTLMVTMALSASVSKLQPSEICVPWNLTSPGHPRSKPMAPYERASMTSYSTLMQHEHIQTILKSQTYPIACLNKNYLDTYIIIFFILIFNL